jgi:hypothetical protein
LPYRPAY